MVETLQYESLPSPQDGVEAEVISIERQRLVRERLEELPDNYREVVFGFYIAEKSYQQMAEEQKVGVKTIETKLYRAR
ncbi:sigma factor-like helix-turn-helix DNA-binding protein, partial [Pseudomonas putida]|uniref:RNA polymerase sigma factor n=1 Tax=Pseudomonas putida TaxID=303 RepID=UPI003525064E